MPAAATSLERSARWTRRFEEAVDAAAAIFCERGYQGASTRDIADRLGIRQATLYYYFPSKEAALAEVCRRGVEDYVERLRVIAAGTGSVAPAPLDIDAELFGAPRDRVGRGCRPLREEPRCGLSSQLVVAACHLSVDR